MAAAAVKAVPLPATLLSGDFCHLGVAQSMHNQKAAPAISLD